MDHNDNPMMYNFQPNHTLVPGYPIKALAACQHSLSNPGDRTPSTSTITTQSIQYTVYLFTRCTRFMKSKRQIAIVEQATQ